MLKSPGKMQGVFLAVLSLLFVYSGPAHAVCTGSGTTWTCTEGSTIAQINSAIAGSADGATITLANGAYSWNSSLVFSIAKSTTLIAESVGGCTVRMGGPLWQWANWGTSHKLYRISGFVFTGVGSYFIWLYGTGSSDATLTSIRFDHNRLTVPSNGSDIITCGEVTGVKTTIFGVIDNNTFTTTNGNSRWIVNYCQTTAATWPSGRIGTVDNLFIEDNTFSEQSQVNTGNAALDTDGGPHSWVVRFNRFINARIEHHGYYWSFPGPANSEIYGNTFTATSGVLNGDRSIKHQGSGEWMVFNNSVTPSSGHGSGILFQNYRSFYDNTNPCNGTDAEDGNRAPLAAYRGYPCNRQPGRNASGVLRPMYFWNNRWTDNNTAIIPDRSCPDQGIANYCDLHMVENRDYYQGGVVAQTSSSSPFNGSSGVGFGTLANRPAACTPTSESADAGHGGVGYWATDAGGNWNTSNGTADDGALYTCTATNTWTLYYTPYTYPHPLRQAGGTAVERSRPRALVDGPAQAAVYDVQGRILLRMGGAYDAAGGRLAGMSVMERTLPNGLYLWRITQGKEHKTLKRMVLR